MSRKNRPEPVSPLATNTAERLAAIVEAAEQAAVAVIDDAEAQARRHLEQAQAEADRIATDRLDAVSGLTDSLLAQVESIRDQSEHLLSSLREAKRLAEGEAGAGSPAARTGEPARSTHLTAVAPIEEFEDEPTESKPIQEGGTPAGARLLATQMAVSGSSRAEIAERLRNGFEIEDTAAILDAILGPED